MGMGELWAKVSLPSAKWIKFAKGTLAEGGTLEIK